LQFSGALPTIFGFTANKIRKIKRQQNDQVVININMIQLLELNPIKNAVSNKDPFIGGRQWLQCWGFPRRHGSPELSSKPH